jgi:twitching motility protein PilJ
MAFKLPFLSKSKAMPATQVDAMVLAGGMVAFPAGQNDPSEPRTFNPDASLIGNALAKAGGIRLPLLGKFPLQQQVRILLGVLGGSLVLGAGFVWLNSATSTVSSTQTQIAGDALMHSQRIGKAAPNAIQGNVEAFRQLADSRKQLNNDLNVLSKGGVYLGRSIDAPNAQLASMLKDVSKVWANSDKAADTILKLNKS